MPVTITSSRFVPPSRLDSLGRTIIPTITSAAKPASAPAMINRERTDALAVEAGSG